MDKLNLNHQAQFDAWALVDDQGLIPFKASLTPCCYLKREWAEEHAGEHEGCRIVSIQVTITQIDEPAIVPAKGTQ